MSLIEKLQLLDDEFVLNESGIRNINALSKEYKTAEIYFHMDTDGVTSAIGMKEYLKKYGIKTVTAHHIQYGGSEYAVPKPRNKTLAVLVDFAHGKPVMKIHTDHHEGQVGVEKGTSTSFVQTPSNAAYISQVISPNDLFPPNDVKIISTVDSADFASQGLQPDDIMRAVFKLDRRFKVEKNHKAMGFVVNTLLLAYKGKKGFLENLVMQAKPSLISMYNVITKLAKDAGYKPPEEVESGKMNYVKQQAGNTVQGKISGIKSLGNGEHMMIGSTIVQYGGGNMRNGYDRYTPFKNHPDADFFTVIWPMGLLQLSKNPFKKAGNPYHLGDIAMKVLQKFKSKLMKDVTLDYVKYVFERDIKKLGSAQSMGFTFHDFAALFEKKAKGLKGGFGEMIADITNKKYAQLSKKQKDQLKRISIPLWDIIVAQSGGHKDITNLQGFAFMGSGKEYLPLMRDVQTEIAKEMKDKHLEE